MEQEVKSVGAAGLLVRNMSNRTVLVLFHHLGAKIKALAAKFTARIFFPADGEDWRIPATNIFDGTREIEGEIEVYPGYRRAQQDIAAILAILTQIKNYAGTGPPSVWDVVWTTAQDNHESYVTGLRARLKELTDEAAWVSKLIDAEQQQHNFGEVLVKALYEINYGFDDVTPEAALARLLKPYPDLVEFLQTKGSDYTRDVADSIEGERS